MKFTESPVIQGRPGGPVLVGRGIAAAMSGGHNSESDSGNGAGAGGVGCVVGPSKRVNLEFEERRARIASSLSMDKENMSHLPSPTPHLLPTISNDYVVPSSLVTPTSPKSKSLSMPKSLLSPKTASKTLLMSPKTSKALMSTHSLDSSVKMDSTTPGSDAAATTDIRVDSSVKFNMDSSIKLLNNGMAETTGKKVGGLPRSNSLGSGGESLTPPLPRKSRLHALGRLFKPWKWKKKKKSEKFEAASKSLERKISVRTSKEELIERGILLPGEVGVWSGDPAPWQGPLPTTSINSNTPTPTTHYNTLPLPNNNTTEPNKEKTEMSNGVEGGGLPARPHSVVNHSPKSQGLMSPGGGVPLPGLTGHNGVSVTVSNGNGYNGTRTLYSPDQDTPPAPLPPPAAAQPRPHSLTKSSGKDGVSMLSIDPNERVTPSGQHHPESLDSIGVTDIGVIPPPPMFSSPSPPPPLPPPPNHIPQRAADDRQEIYSEESDCSGSEEEEDDEEGRDVDDPAGRVVTVAAREPKMDAQPLKPALKKPKEATRNQNNDKHSSSLGGGRDRRGAGYQFTSDKENIPHPDEDEDGPILYRDDEDEGDGEGESGSGKDGLGKHHRPPTKQEIIDRSVLFQMSEDERMRDRNIIGAKLIRRLSLRPTAEELLERNILKKSDEQQRQQEKEEKKRYLLRKLSFRPSVDELKTRKIIKFNDYIEVTPCHEYDRRADKPWTRLTPKDKANIRKELNDYKSSEMDVHDQSRHLTRFHRP